VWKIPPSSDASVTENIVFPIIRMTVNTWTLIYRVQTQLRSSKCCAVCELRRIYDERGARFFTLSTVFSIKPRWLKETNMSSCGFLLHHAVRAVRASQMSRKRLSKVFYVLSMNNVAGAALNISKECVLDRSASNVVDKENDLNFKRSASPKLPTKIHCVSEDRTSATTSQRSRSGISRRAECGRRPSDGPDQDTKCFTILFLNPFLVLFSVLGSQGASPSFT
jgi:hypothetical protein